MKFKKFLDEKMNESYDDFKKITIVCRDNDKCLEMILNAIKDKGNVGHSFDVIVDPDDEPEKIGWDGDGSDYIKSIKVE